MGLMGATECSDATTSCDTCGTMSKLTEQAPAAREPGQAAIAEPALARAEIDKAAAKMRPRMTFLLHACIETECYMRCVRCEAESYVPVSKRDSLLRSGCIRRLG